MNFVLETFLMANPPSDVSCRFYPERVRDHVNVSSRVAGFSSSIPPASSIAAELRDAGARGI